MNKITQQEFEQRIKNRFPTESFTIIQYSSIGKPLIIECDKCHEKIEVNKANNFLAPTKAYGCKNCHGLWKEREIKLNEIKKYYNIISTEVKETHTYYTVECKQCGHIRTTTLKNLYRHLKCGCETNVMRNRNAEEFIEEVNKNSKLGTYSLISEYKNQTSKVLLKHNYCGFIWNVRPADVIHAHSQCPKCMRKHSKGELYIKKILDENKISYEMEKQLNNSLQRFDFYLENKNVKIAIEYNSVQHYKENNFFRTSLEDQQERDYKKRKYCKENNILLFEIPYTLSNEEIYNYIIEIIAKFNDYPKKEQI